MSRKQDLLATMSRKQDLLAAMSPKLDFLATISRKHDFPGALIRKQNCLLAAMSQTGHPAIGDTQDPTTLDHH